MKVEGLQQLKVEGLQQLKVLINRLTFNRLICNRLTFLASASVQIQLCPAENG
jgi:hypothetical protein